MLTDWRNQVFSSVLTICCSAIHKAPLTNIQPFFLCKITIAEILLLLFSFLPQRSSTHHRERHPFSISPSVHAAVCCFCLISPDKSCQATLNISHYQDSLGFLTWFHCNPLYSFASSSFSNKTIHIPVTNVYFRETSSDEFRPATRIHSWFCWSIL